MNKDALMTIFRRCIDQRIWAPDTYEELNQATKQWLQGLHWYQPILKPPSEVIELRIQKQGILKEFFHYYQVKSGNIPRLQEIDEREGALLDDTKEAWRVVFLRICTKDTKIATQFPLTLSLINRLQCSTAYFSILEPGKIIPEHEGYYCGITRYHLGILVPDGCTIKIAGKEYIWDPDLCFDDTFPHSVSNPTAKFRIVLLLDLIRDLGDCELNNLNAQVIQKASEQDIAQSDLIRANAVT